MKKLILATASVLALGIAGSGVGYAAESTSSSTTPPASTMQSQSTMPQSTQTQTAPVNPSEGQIKQVQEQLKSAGLYKGTADGKMGAETKQAISEFQQQHNLTKTGTLDQETMAALSNQGNTGSGSSVNSSAQPPSSSGAGAPLNPSTTPSTSR